MFSTVAGLNKKRPKKKSVEAEEPATNATPITDPSISERQSTQTEKEKESLRLEDDLDAAVRSANVVDGTIPTDEGKLGSQD